MSCAGTSNCTCGCCAGTSVQTPQQPSNPPGLAAVAYRVGTWAGFKESMLARLSSADYPALAPLTSRSDDDFTIAFLDATAMVLDILTFYQERLANESYLRTAIQLRSLTELSRLISFQPTPGVSASAYLAFTLKATPGQPPNPSAAAITIPQGTQVQSVPAQGQTPQTFETSADIQAKPDWNALPLQAVQPWLPDKNDISVYLSGTSTNLQPGDAILIVGDARINASQTHQGWDAYDVRLVLKVQPDAQNNRTWITWNEGLRGTEALSPGSPPGSPPDSPPSSSPGSPAQNAPKIYALRQRAALFGYNAIDPNLLNTANTNVPNQLNAGITATIGGTITPGDSVTLTVALEGSPGSQASLTYTAGHWDDLRSFAAALGAAINGNPDLQKAGIWAVVQGNIITVSMPISLGTSVTVSDGTLPSPPRATELVTIAPISYGWRNYQMSQWIDLDSVYPKIVQGGWVVLMQPEGFDSAVQNSKRSLPGRVNLYQVSSVAAVSRTAFGLSAKTSRIFPDTDACLVEYDLRTTLALVQSEELAVAPQPLTYPLYGTVLDLADLRPDLAGARVLALSGTRQKIAIANGVTSLIFVPDDTSQSSNRLSPGDVLTVTDPTPLLTIPLPPAGADAQIALWTSVSPLTISSLYVEDANGRTGSINNISLNQFILSPSSANDPVVSEYALVSSLGPVGSGYPHTQIQLAKALANCYDRTTTTVNANVGLATQGQSVSDILGSGSASTPNQSFTLKHSPLTFVPAPTSSGTQSTLEVLVNSVAWPQVPSLYDQGPASPVFATLNQADGTTDIMFGDGVEGALLPTGQNNLQANYRYGLGSSGNVPARTLTTLMDRPLGVSGVTNPQAATGGQDPQSTGEIRGSASQAVLTLGRAVSIADYQNYAATFAGIAKAYATWIPSGPGRGVFLTVAGVNGVALPPGSATQAGLVASLKNYGNPLIPITVVTYAETLFSFSADLQYDPGYDQAAVQAHALETVSGAFSFGSRSFGQGVSIDEIAAVIQGVPGVVAVNVTALTREQSSTAGDISGLAGTLTVAELKDWLASQIVLPRLFPDSTTQLYAYLPVSGPQAQPFPAEILVLDPAFTVAAFGVMS